MGNNPIINADVLGDSSWYYNGDKHEYSYSPDLVKTNAENWFLENKITHGSYIGQTGELGIETNNHDGTLDFDVKYQLYANGDVWDTHQGFLIPEKPGGFDIGNTHYTVNPYQNSNILPHNVELYTVPWMPEGYGVTLPPFGVFVGRNTPRHIKLHEFGHHLNYEENGFWSYYTKVGLPSIINSWENNNGLPGIAPHMSSEPEIDANNRARGYFGNNSPAGILPYKTLYDSSSFLKVLKNYFIFKSLQHP